MGIASLVTGILAFFSALIPSGVPGIILGLAAVILGVLGRGRLLEQGRSAGVALGGIVLGILAFLVGITNLVVCIFVCKAVDNLSPEEAMEQVRQRFAQHMPPGSMPPGAMPPGATPPGVVPTPAAPPPVPPPSSPPVPGGNLTVMVNQPVSSTFGPGLPVEPESGRPYVDYTLNVAAHGNYSITLITMNSGAYDPYLRLLLNGAEVANDDDSGGAPNAQINRPLTPGNYVVRVSSFRQQVTAPTPFTLSVASM